MDWSNRFTIGGFTVTYCTFQMAWEVIEKTEDEDRTEISHPLVQEPESCRKVVCEKDVRCALKTERDLRSIL